MTRRGIVWVRPYRVTTDHYPSRDLVRDVNDEPVLVLIAQLAEIRCPRAPGERLVRADRFAMC
jgi:hypothetical protein